MTTSATYSLRSRNKTARAPKTKASSRPAPKETFVKKMIVTVSRNGRLSKHELYFNQEPLSLKEMYNVGFLGDLEFCHPGGIIEKAELEAAPLGEFNGDVVGRFVFKITKPGTDITMNANVVKFNFFKTI